jgi:hypothetical protein
MKLEIHTVLLDGPSEHGSGQKNLISTTGLPQLTNPDITVKFCKDYIRCYLYYAQNGVWR